MTLAEKSKVTPVTGWRTRNQASLNCDPYSDIRRLIWLYLALWLVEGGLRRWFLPGLATPLLLVRDPVIFFIYALAWSKNLFPMNGFILSAVVLAFADFANALMIGHGNPIVAFYGIRCDFMHVPLIFIMARVLRQEDLLRLAKAAVWLAIPYTLLLVAQFYQPQDAWVNRGVGGSLEGAGFGEVDGHFRPPGTFSFISGPTALYPLFTACWFALFLNRNFSPWLMTASAMAILVAVPVSISRSLFLSVAMVVLAGLVAMILGGRLSLSAIMQIAVVLCLLPLLAFQVPAFKDGMDAFASRWASSTADGGGFKTAIWDRVMADLFGPFASAEYAGLGTGYSTNVGQKLLTSQIGFGASEGEWGRLLYDNGLILGGLMVAYRVCLAGSILMASLRAWRRGAALSLIFASTCVFGVLEGQWGQATNLGGAVIGAGLALAAAANQKTGGFGETRG